MVDGLKGLGHNAVVGCYYQHHDVGGVGPPGPHGCKRGVARGVDERQGSPFLVHLIGTDVLGDAPGLAVGHVGVADLVEQLGLAVVHVAHNGDHRRPDGEVLCEFTLVEVGLQQFEQLVFLLLPGIHQPDLCAYLGGKELDHVIGQGLGRGDHLSLLHEESDYISSRLI